MSGDPSRLRRKRRGERCPRPEDFGTAGGEDLDLSGRYLGGDFNSFTQADAEQIEEIYEQAGFIRASEASGNTIVKHGVGFPSDHIFAKGLVVKEAGKLEKAAASEHLPIWVTLVLQ